MKTCRNVHYTVDRRPRHVQSRSSSESGAKDAIVTSLDLADRRTYPAQVALPPALPFKVNETFLWGEPCTLTTLVVCLSHVKVDTV